MLMVDSQMMYENLDISLLSLRRINMTLHSFSGLNTNLYPVVCIFLPIFLYTSSAFILSTCYLLNLPHILPTLRNIFFSPYYHLSLFQFPYLYYLLPLIIFTIFISFLTFISHSSSFIFLHLHNPFPPYLLILLFCTPYYSIL